MSTYSKKVFLTLRNWIGGIERVKLNPTMTIVTDTIRESLKPVNLVRNAMTALSIRLSGICIFLNSLLEETQ